MINGNKSVIANFSIIPPNQWTLNTSAANGTIAANPNPTNGTHVDGPVVTLTATPEIGFEFEILIKAVRLFDLNGNLINLFFGKKMYLKGIPSGI